MKQRIYWVFSHNPWEIGVEPEVKYQRSANGAPAVCKWSESEGLYWIGFFSYHQWHLSAFGEESSEVKNIIGWERTY